MLVKTNTCPNVLYLIKWQITKTVMLNLGQWERKYIIMSKRPGFIQYDFWSDYQQMWKWLLVQEINKQDKENKILPLLFFYYVLNTSWATLIENLEVWGRGESVYWCRFVLAFIQKTRVWSNSSYVFKCSPPPSLPAQMQSVQCSQELSQWELKEIEALWTPAICCNTRVWLLDFSIIRNMSWQCTLWLSNRFKWAIHRFQTFQTALERVCNSTVQMLFRLLLLDTLHHLMPACISVYLYVRLFRDCEIFMLWTVWALAEGQLHLALDLPLSVWDKRMERAEEPSSYGFNSQTLVVLSGQRLTSGRCLFMRAVNTGSGRL